MATIEAAFESLKRHLASEVRRDEPMAPRTSIKVGGTADLFLQPGSAEELQRALQLLADAGLPWVVMGGGANTLVGDGGIRGAVIRLTHAPADEVERREGGIEATLAAGAPIARLVKVMREHAVTGAEFMVGIPGTLGGAIRMNAGTKNGWVQYCLREVQLVDATGIRWVPRDDLHFAYRHTELPAGCVVHRARFWLPDGDVEKSRTQMDEDVAYRRSTQPLQLPNFGSTFVNPPKGSAGRLIEEAGLKGHRVGNAQISDVHANFIVNHGGAKAAEVVALIERAQREVFERTGIRLVHEVKRVGEF